MTFDNIREYIVIVNNGSGCIVQAEKEAYSYILTAKHNIAAEDPALFDLTRFEFTSGRWEEVKIRIKDLVLYENYFPHGTKDIAILKVDKIKGLDKLVCKVDIDGDTRDFLLVGYPETRRKANPGNKIEWFRQDRDVSILNTIDHGLREAQVPGNPGIEEIRGHSGGCILKPQTDYLLIAGIQNRMANAAQEQLGRIVFSPMRHFDEIIAGHPDHLLPILASDGPGQGWTATLILPAGYRYNTVVIRKLLLESLSDDQLNSLCMDLFLAVYNEFSAGMKKGQKIQVLMEYCIRHVGFPKLIAAVKDINPIGFSEHERALIVRI